MSLHHQVRFQQIRKARRPSLRNALLAQTALLILAAKNTAVVLIAAGCFRARRKHVLRSLINGDALSSPTLLRIPYWNIVHQAREISALFCLVNLPSAFHRFIGIKPGVLQIPQSLVDMSSSGIIHRRIWAEPNCLVEIRQCPVV